MMEGMTSYAPAEASERTGLSLDTLRYYERLGLFGPVGRTAGGRRIYTERDVAWAPLLVCLRRAGLGSPTSRGSHADCVTVRTATTASSSSLRVTAPGCETRSPK